MINRKGLLELKVKSYSIINKSFSTKAGLVFEKTCVSLLKKDCKFTCVRKKYIKGWFLNETSLKFTLLFKSWFFKYLKNYNYIVKPHGCKEPDAVFIVDNQIFILEFKYQNQNGSVAEKLQTGVFKQMFFSKCLEKKFKVHYIYILSPWFRDNCILELNYLKMGKVSYYFSDDKWTDSLICFIKENV